MSLLTMIAAFRSTAGPRRRGWTVAWTVVAVLLVCGRGAAPAREQLDASGRFVVRWWNAEDGFPETPLTGLAFAPDGTLVCGSRSRLVRFDGTTFEPFSRKLTDQLHAAIGDFWSIGFDGSGRLWVQGGRAVARLDPGSGPAGTSREGGWTIYWPLQDAITGMTFAKDGRPICVGPGSLQIFNGHGFTAIAASEAAAPTTGRSRPSWRYGKCDPRDGSVWLWEGGGATDVFRLDPPFREGPSPPAPAAGAADAPPALSIGIGPSGASALLADGVAVHRGDAWERLPLDLPDGDSRLSGKIAEATDGTVWVSTHDALHGCGRKRIETTVAGLPGFSLYTHVLLADAAGGIWAACSGGLLAIHRAPAVIDASAGCTAVFERADGSLVVGGSGFVECRRYDDEARLVSRETIASLPGHAVPTALLETPEGRLWVGTQDAFLLRIDDGLVTQVTKPAAESFRELRSIQALARDGTGRIWAGTSNGLAVHDPDRGTFTMAATHGGKSPLRIIGLAVDPEGGLLVAGGGRGVDRILPDGRVERILDRATMPGRRDIVFHRDSRRTLWIGGETGLVRVAADGSVHRLSTEDGLVDDAVRQIEEDAAGRLWLATRDGWLQGIRLADLDALAAGRVTMVRGLVVHATGGLPGASCLGRIARDNRQAAAAAGAPATRGTFVIPLDQGILRFDATAAGTIATAKQPPAIDVDLLDGGRTVRFRSRVPGMHLDAAPPCQTFLHGRDVGWSSPGHETVRDVHGLAPGRYALVVRTVAGETDASFPQASIDLEIPTPWWRTPWSLAAGAAVLVAAATWMSRRFAMVRERRAVAALQRQRDREQERARIARDIHDSLGAGLTRMALASENARRGRHPPEELDRRLDALYRDAHALARTVDEIVWAVNPCHDTLAGFVAYTMQEVEDSARAAELQLRFDVDDDLPPRPLDAAVRHQLCLAVREAVQNALKHADGTTLGYGVRIVDDVLQVTIEDDGRGFDPEAVAAGTHDGLRNIRSRIDELRGGVRILSAAAAGTRVIITVPLASTAAAARDEDQQRAHH